MTALDESAVPDRAGMSAHASVHLMPALEAVSDIEFLKPMLGRRAFQSIAPEQATIRAALDELEAGSRCA